MRERLKAWWVTKVEILRKELPSNRLWRAARHIPRSLLWIVLELSGLRFIFEKAIPPKPETRRRPAPTIVLWIMGLYIALFGIASQRYENRVDRIELRANAIVGLLANERTRVGAFPQVGKVQNMQAPKRPVFLGGTPGTWVESVESVYRSLTQEKPDTETVEFLRDIIVSLKTQLAGVNLLSVNLAGASLWDANLAGANLFDANLAGVNLTFANLEGANLGHANLRDIKNWERIRSMKNANIRGVKYAPEGFHAWALQNGAVVRQD